MPRRLDITKEATADIDDIDRWLTQPGAGVEAQRKLQSIQSSIRALIDRPCLYPVGQRRGTREMSCRGGYRAIYRVDPDTGDNQTAGDVTILRVFGPAQDRRIFHR